MDKETIKDIIYELRQFEWKLNPMDDGPDEYRCPDYCCISKFKNQDPEFFIHTKNCSFQKIINILEEELRK